MTIATNPTTPENQPQPEASQTPAVDAAIAATETPVPDESAKPAAEKSLDELAGMSDTELDALLVEGTQKVDAPVGTPPAADPAAPAAPSTPAAPAAKTDEDEEQGDPNAVVPRARLNQEIAKRKELEKEASTLREERAYFAGRAEAAKAAGPTPAQDADPEQVVEQNLQTLDKNYRQAVVAIAKKFDDGELSAVEMETKKQELSDARDRLRGEFTTQLDQIRTQKSAPDPVKLAKDVNEHAGLIAHTAELEAANPWMNTIPDRFNDMLMQEAEKVLANQGIYLGRNPTFDEMVGYTADLRTAMVDVAKAWFPEKVTAAPAANPNPAPKPPTTPTAAQPTPAQLQAKLGVARSQPPVPNLAGASLPVDALAGVSEDISVDELAKLKPQELDAIIEREQRRNTA